MVQGKFVASRVLNRAIQYASGAIPPAYTWKRMRPAVPDLLRTAIFPLTCFDEEDARLWEEDPHEYIRKACACRLSVSPCLPTPGSCTHELLVSGPCRSQRPSTPHAGPCLLGLQVTCFAPQAFAPAPQ